MYEEDARRLHEQLWQLREVEKLDWWEIERRLGVPRWRLREIRRTAQRLGLAVKEGHDVRWLEPDRGRSRRRRRAVTRAPDARQLATALVGSTIYTLDQRKPNE